MRTNLLLAAIITGISSICAHATNGQWASAGWHVFWFVCSLAGGFVGDWIIRRRQA